MDLFWCLETNRLIVASPCTECQGFAWRCIGQDTGGMWQFAGCFPDKPDAPFFMPIPSKKTQPAVIDGDLK